MISTSAGFEINGGFNPAQITIGVMIAFGTIVMPIITITEKAIKP